MIEPQKIEVERRGVFEGYTSTSRWPTPDTNVMLEMNGPLSCVVPVRSLRYFEIPERAGKTSERYVRFDDVYRPSTSSQRAIN